MKLLLHKEMLKDLVTYNIVWLIKINRLIDSKKVEKLIKTNSGLINWLFRRQKLFWMDTFILGLLSRTKEIYVSGLYMVTRLLLLCKIYEVKLRSCTSWHFYHKNTTDKSITRIKEVKWYPKALITFELYDNCNKVKWGLTNLIIFPISNLNLSGL